MTLPPKILILQSRCPVLRQYCRGTVAGTQAIIVPHMVLPKALCMCSQLVLTSFSMCGNKQDCLMSYTGLFPSCRTTNQLEGQDKAPKHTCSQRDRPLQDSTSKATSWFSPFPQVRKVVPGLKIPPNSLGAFFPLNIAINY